MDGKKINAVQLGRKIGVSHVAVGNFLKGQLPKSETLFELAKCFGKSMDYFLSEHPSSSERSLDEIANLPFSQATPEEMQRLMIQQAKTIEELQEKVASMEQVFQSGPIFKAIADVIAAKREDLLTAGVSEKQIAMTEGVHRVIGDQLTRAAKGVTGSGGKTKVAGAGPERAAQVAQESMGAAEKLAAEEISRSRPKGGRHRRK